jgi:hypothetical protein
LRTKIRKLRKSLKLVADKKNIPRNQINESDGNSSVAYLVAVMAQQQQQRSLQSDDLAHGGALSLWTHVFFLNPNFLLSRQP